MTVEILNCPFCGASAAADRNPSANGGYVSDMVVCQNDECLTSTRFYETPAEAIAAWNTRHPQPDAVRGRDCPLQASPSVPTALAERLSAIRTEHLRLATWNRSKDRPARVAFHHDAAITLAEAIRQATTPSPTPARDGDEVGVKQ